MKKSLICLAILMGGLMGYMLGRSGDNAGGSTVVQKRSTIINHHQSAPIPVSKPTPASQAAPRSSSNDRG